MVGRRKSNHHLPPRMYLKSGTYYYVTQANKWISLGRELPAAKIKWAEFESGGTPKGITMTQVIDRYMREVAPLKAAATLAGNKMESENLLKVFGAMIPADLRTEDVYAFMQARAQKRQIKDGDRVRIVGGPVRANRERSLLSSIMSYACSWGYCTTNPVREAKPFQEQPRTRYIEDWEFQVVRELANPMVRAMMDIAYLTVQRGQDILALRLDAIKDDGMHLMQKKTSRSKPVKLLISWSEELRAAVDVLRGLERPYASLYLVTERNGGKLSERGWKTAWQRTINAAMASGVIQERFHFHDIRAKAITDLESSGRDAQEISGHSTRDMIERVYRRRMATTVKPVR